MTVLALLLERSPYRKKFSILFGLLIVTLEAAHGYMCSSEGEPGVLLMIKHSCGAE
jgi:hypothetical protein